MAERRYLSIRNWSRYQHYKQGRTPPWIKLYNSILDDPDFFDLPDASKYHVIACMLLASRTGNRIWANTEYLQQQIHAKDPIYLGSMAHFFDDDSNMLSTCFQDACLEEKRIEEKRGEESIGATHLTPPAKTRTAKVMPPPETPYTEGFLTAWEAYPHYESRSGKAQSFEVWRRRKLEPLSHRVVLWISAGKDGNDWKKEAGSLVPGMQVWLKKPDFLDDPPKVIHRYLSEKGRRTAENMQRWLESHRSEDDAH